MKTDDFILMPIPASQYAAVCALLGGAALSTGNVASGPGAGSTAVAPSVADEPLGSDAAASPPVATDAGANAPADDVELDAHGHPWDENMHASTKGKTKDGLWRMKPGVSRPDPAPGFPKDEPSADTGTSTATPTPSATSPTATAPESAPSATSGAEEDDEFAAFREAAAKSDETDAAAAASAPTARQWSDADLGALCNQAAVKLGDPAPIKEIIAQYVPQGEVTHSRNIPADKREDFAKAVEAKAGIEFAG